MVFVEVPGSSSSFHWGFLFFLRGLLLQLQDLLGRLALLWCLILLGRGLSVLDLVLILVLVLVLVLALDLNVKVFILITLFALFLLFVLFTLFVLFELLLLKVVDLVQVLEFCYHGLHPLGFRS